MAATSEHIVKISADLTNLKSGLNQADASVKKLGDQIKNTFGTILGAYAGIQGVQQLVEVAKKFQGMELALKAMTGSTGAAQKEMNFLINTSRQLGIDISATSDSFTKLVAAAKGTSLEGQGVRGIFTAIAQEATVLQLSNQQVEKSFYAIQQMISKGTVQMEELKGQLGDALPDALQLAAKGMGKTTEQLLVMIQKGEVLTNDFLPKLEKAIKEKYGEAAVEASKLASSSINKLMTEFTLLEKQIGGPLLESMGKAAEMLKQGVANEAVKDTLVAIATAAGYAAEKIAALFTVLLNTAAATVEALAAVVNGLLAVAAATTGNMKLAGAFADGMKENWGKSRDAILALTGGGGAFKKLDDSIEASGTKGAKNIQKMSKEAEKFKKTLEDLSDSVHRDLLFADAEASGNPFTETEKKLYDIKTLIEKNKKAYEELGPAGKKALAGIYDDLAKLEEAEKKIASNKALAEPFIHALENIQDAFASTFEDIFTNGVDSFGDLADKMKSVMIKAAAEIAAALVFKPILAEAVSAGLGGVAPSLAASIIKGMGVETAGGSNGLGVINPLSSIGSNLLGSSGLFSGFNASVGSALPSLFGTGAPLAGTIGPTQAGLFTGMGMTPATMGLGLVAAIAIPMIAGMLGGGKPHPGASFGGTLGDTGAFDGYDLRAKHMDTEGVKKLAESLDAIFQSLGAASIDLNNPTIQGRIDSNGQAQFGVGSNLNGGSIQWNDLFNPSDANALDDAIKGLMKQLLSTADVTNKDVIEALKNMEWEGKKVADILTELQLASTFDALRNELNRALNKDLVGIFDPALKEISDENDRYAAQLELAKKISGDVATVERLHQERLLQIQVKYSQGVDATGASVDGLNESLKDAQTRFKTFGDMVKSLSDFSTSLNLGNLSPLTAQEKYRIAQQAFNSTASLARLGNTDAMKDLPKVAQDFLTVSREFNAGSGAYTEDFNNVQKAVEDARAVAVRQQNLAETQVTTLQNQLTEAQKQTDLLQQLVDKGSSKGYSYGAAYLAGLANPMESGLVNTQLGETINGLKQRNFGWGNASGLEVRSLGRAFGFTDVFGTGLFDKWLQDNRGDLLNNFNDALTAIGGTPRFRASGGMVNPAFPYIVGESGREMFTPNVQGRVMNATETATMLSYSGRGGNDNGSVAAINALTKEIRITNQRVETLQKQVNSNMLFRKVAG